VICEASGGYERAVIQALQRRGIDVSLVPAIFPPLAYHSERRKESHNPPNALVFRNLAAPRKNFRFRASRFGSFDVAVAIVKQ
jgi:transposase